MTKTVAVIATVLALALPIAAPSYAQVQVPVQSSTPLPVLTPENVATELASDKPTFVIVAGDSCEVCAEVAKLVNKYPQVKFLQGRGSDLGVSPDALTLFVVNIPEVGVAFEKAQFAPSDLENFIVKRIEVAERQTAAALNLRAVREKMKAAAQPFDDQLKALSADFDALWKPYADRIKAAQAKEDAARAAFDDEFYALQEKVETPRKPLVEELIELRHQATWAVRDDAQSTSYAQSVDDLRKAYGQTEKELDELRSKGIVETDGAYKALADRLTQIKESYSQAVKVSQEHDAQVAKPFTDRMQLLRAQLREIAIQSKPESEALDAKINKATKPFADEAASIDAEGKLVLKPYFDRIEMAKSNKARAVGRLKEELRKAMQALDKSFDESTNEVK